MLPLSTIRGWQLDQLRKTLQTVNSVLKGASPQDAMMFRDGGSGWTALEVLCHLRDYEKVFFERARLTVEQEVPDLPNPNPDELAAEGRYNQQDVQQVYAEWSHRRADFLEFLEGLDESAWSRVGNHPRRGKMSVHDQLTLTVWHDANHIEQMTRVLAEKQAAVSD